MAKLLITFCNIFPHNYPLGLYDTLTDQFQWVPTHSFLDKLWTAQGICKKGNK